MTTLVWDKEADGLLYDATRIWCMTTGNVETGEIIHYGPDDIENGLHALMDADHIVGHNAIGYDLALARKLYPWFTYNLRAVDDTFVMSSGAPRATW